MSGIKNESEKRELFYEIEELFKENERLTEENNNLKKLVNETQIKLEKLEVKDDNANPCFCYGTILDFYFSNEFDEYFPLMLKNLDLESKQFFKHILLRDLCYNFNKKETFFTLEEIKEQELHLEFRKSIKINNQNEFCVNGFKFVNNFYEIPCLIDTGLNEEDKIFVKDKDIIDAGAYTGDSTFLLSKLTSKKVYGFEPLPETFELMQKNIKLNEIKNIIPICSALGNKEGDAKIFIRGHNNLGSTLDPNKNYSEEKIIKCTTIDNFVEKNNLDVGFIKTDVEGAEQELLEGAINTIKTQKPILFVSIYHNIDDLFKIKPWIENLGLNYEFKITKESPNCYLGGTILECRAK